MVIRRQISKKKISCIDFNFCECTESHCQKNSDLDVKKKIKNTLGHKQNNMKWSFQVAVFMITGCCYCSQILMGE